MPRLLIVGGASLDVLHLPGRSVRSAGGAGLYTGLAARRSGVEVTMYGPRPHPMPPELAAVDSRLDWVGPVVAVEELPRFEIVHHGEGRQELIDPFWGAEATLRPDRIPPLAEAPDWVYCVPLADPGLQLAFLRHFKGQGRRVAGGTYGRLAREHLAETRAVLQLCDAFFCNEREAETLFGSVDAAVAQPGRLLFVTRGAQGVRVVQGGHATDVPGVGAPELDPTGAGDTLCGSALARLSQGLHPVEAARHAVAHAAEMIGAVGPAALLRPTPAPVPAEDGRVRIDWTRLARVAELLAVLPEVRPFDFVSDVLPRPRDPGALGFFFAATLQQFGFWSLAGGRYEAPLVARLAGRPLKGSDYLWAAYLRWRDADPSGLAPAAQAAVERAAFDARLASDQGSNPLPAAELALAAARAYGHDMRALDWTPAAMLERANADPEPAAAMLTQLDHVGGYKEDPLRKKSALLATILQQRPEAWLDDRGRATPPIVDYHVQRSVLRLGVIAVEDAGLRARLCARQELAAADEDAVRRVAFRAAAALAEASGRSMAACDAFLFRMRHLCPEMSDPDCAACPADPVCAHRKELFQPVRRTSFY